MGTDRLRQLTDELSRISSLLRTGSHTERLTGKERDAYLDKVWPLYILTYTPIGLPLHSPQQMMKYQVWDVNLNAAGEVLTFVAYKDTRFGLKSGLSGHNGSSEGKAAAIHGARTKYKTPGIYGEVSHKVEQIVLAAGSPVICAEHAERVLGDPIVPEEDGLHYKRSLTGLGMMRKIMVGMPHGIPTTTITNPSCGVTAAYEVFGEPDEELSIHAHYASLALSSII